MRSVGRDDPCPCGSGLVYRNCCSRHARAPLARAFDGAVRESALSKLLTFAFQPAFDADHSVAEVVFWGDLLRGATPDGVQRLLDSDDANVKYNSWFLFDWEIDGTGTVADLFLEEQTVALSEAERHFLETLSRVHLRLFEVELVERGRGVRLIDLWTGERTSVAERPATQQIVTWDVLGARVLPDGGGGHRFEGGLYLYPAPVKEQLLARFRRARQRHRRSPAGNDPARFFRKHAPLFHHVWLELVAFPEAPQVLTADGDPLMFCRAVFETERLEEVRALMGGHPDVRPGADGRFVLHEQAAVGAREIGRWSFEGERVVFETTSQARAARGRMWLDAVAGGLVQYRATALETLEQTMEVLRRPAAVRAPEPGGQGAARAVTELFDRHYQSWLDRPEPALGNRAPRSAARTKTWRPRVIELLKRLENDAERAALAGRPPYNFRWIWAELHLDRVDGGK